MVPLRDPRHKPSKIIHHFSSIAWYSLCKFCQKNENSEYMRIIQNAVACVLKVVGKHDILINQDGKKNRKMVGNTPFTSLHITHCRTTKDYEPERAKKRMILQFVLLYALAQMKIQIIFQHFLYLGKKCYLQKQPCLHIFSQRWTN